MPRRPSMRRLIPLLVAIGCYANDPELGAPGDHLEVGTWGAENAGVIVSDTTAHVHVACTLGDFPMPVTLDSEGRFTVTGTYVLRAYPVFVGPHLPAQYSGRVLGNRLTLSVAVNDTVEKKMVAVGPVTVTLGREPRMGPCPICDKEQD